MPGVLSLVSRLLSEIYGLIYIISAGLYKKILSPAPVPSIWEVFRAMGIFQFYLNLLLRMFLLIRFQF